MLYISKILDSNMNIVNDIIEVNFLTSAFLLRSGKYMHVNLYNYLYQVKDIETGEICNYNPSGLRCRTAGMFGVTSNDFTTISVLVVDDLLMQLHDFINFSALSFLILYLHEGREYGILIDISGDTLIVFYNSFTKRKTFQINGDVTVFKRILLKYQMIHDCTGQVVLRED